MAPELTLGNLQEAVKTAAAFRCRTKLQPVGADGDKVFPPTYAGGVYAVEDRMIDGRVARCVLLDSVQSQANRMEEALQDAFLPDWRDMDPKAGAPDCCGLPILAVYVNERHGWVTSLTAPHRVHDAILRDSEVETERDGQKARVRFRDSNIGKAVVAARLHDAAAFYRYCPTALLFGTWDSTAGEGLDSAKIPRAVVSEIIGVDVTPGIRTSSRLDPLGIKAQSATIYRRTDGGWAIQGEDDWIGAQPRDIKIDKNGQPERFGKGKPSDINHGNVTPDLDRFGDAREVRDQHLDRLPDILRREGATPIVAYAVRPGGVTMAYALRTWTLSLTQLRRLRFPMERKHNESRDSAARTVLAALAVYAVALQHARGGWLRSRCELVPCDASQYGAVVLTQIQADGTSPVDFRLPTVDEARELLCEALKEAEAGTAGIVWEKRVVRLTATELLSKLVELSDARQPDDSGDGAAGVDDAGDQS